MQHTDTHRRWGDDRSPSGRPPFSPNPLLSWPPAVTWVTPFFPPCCWLNVPLTLDCSDFSNFWQLAKQTRCCEIYQSSTHAISSFNLTTKLNTESLWHMIGTVFVSSDTHMLLERWARLYPTSWGFVCNLSRNREQISTLINLSLLLPKNPLLRSYSSQAAVVSPPPSLPQTLYNKPTHCLFHSLHAPYS